MGYNAQLVVRSRDPQGTDIIDKVKALADEQDKTYSEMALELLERGLSGDAAAPAKQAKAEPAKKAKPAAPPEPEPEQAAEPEAEEAGESEAEAPDAEAPDAEASQTDEQAAEQAEDEEEQDLAAIDVPAVDGSVADVAQACLDQLEENGPQAAAKILANFFSDAGPIEGGKVKNILKDELTKAEYEVILDKLRDTKEYRNYRQRVIFER